MNLRKIHLDICLKCQIESAMAGNLLGEISLARPACCMGDWGHEKTDAFVYWTRRHSVCGMIKQPDTSLGRKFNDFVEKRLYQFVLSTMTEECRIGCMKKSISVLNDAMEKFPCKCEINERNCPYLMEQMIFDINRSKDDA